MTASERIDHGGMDIKLYDHPAEGKPGYAVVEVGGHAIHVREVDGDPHLYLQDHASIRVEGELKDEVTVVVGTDEFPTEIVALNEHQFQERYK